MGKRLEVEIGTLVFTANPNIDAQLQIDYLPDSHEVVVSRDFPQPFVIGEGSDEVLILHIQNVELRLSEDAVRQLIDVLPPEMLH